MSGYTKRCIGPWPNCGHPPNTCTASPSYQAGLIVKIARTPPAMSAAELIDRLRAWPSPQIGADYSVNAIKAQMAEAADLIEALSAHPAPIKPSADTGELRDRVARVIHPKPWSEDYELADAILDLIQSERAG